MAGKNLNKESLKLTGRIFNVDRRTGFSKDREAYRRFFMEREHQVRQNLKPLSSEIIRTTKESLIQRLKDKAPKIIRKDKNKPYRIKRGPKADNYIGRPSDKPFGESNFYDWKVWQRLTPKAKSKFLKYNHRGGMPEMHMEFRRNVKRKRQSRDLPYIGEGITTSRKSKEYKPTYPESGSNSDPHKSYYGTGVNKRNINKLKRQIVINSLPKEKKITPKKRK
jgi:hypothetical protein